jgi:Concanavalin A-like lectin/glucanases superfamily
MWTGTVLSGALLILAGVAACGVGSSRNRPAGIVEDDSCRPRSADPTTQVADNYDRQVLSLGPVLYLTLAHPSSPTEADLSGNGNTATYLPANDRPAQATLPNGDPAAEFNGLGQYVKVASASTLSVPRTGCLTVEAWIQPATLQFPHEEGTGYVYILGKGTSGKQEYALRIYSIKNSESPVRPNRISAYAFNLAGGLGSGAYFQDKVAAGEWIMVTFVIDAKKSPTWPDGYVAIYKNGDLRGRVSLGQYDVKPKASTAPFCIATRNYDSYFEGAIGKVAVYDFVLSRAEIAATYNAMFSTGTRASV